MTGIVEQLRTVVGSEWSIALPGLSTAGYVWRETVVGPPGVVEVSWHRGTPQEQSPAPIGRSAPEHLLIRAVGPGEVTLDLVQARPWEADAVPAAQRRITVTVS